MQQEAAEGGIALQASICVLLCVLLCCPIPATHLPQPVGGEPHLAGRTLHRIASKQHCQPGCLQQQRGVLHGTARHGIAAAGGLSEVVQLASIEAHP